MKRERRKGRREKGRKGDEKRGRGVVKEICHGELIVFFSFHAFCYPYLSIYYYWEKTTKSNQGMKVMLKGFRTCVLSNQVANGKPHRHEEIL